MVWYDMGSSLRFVKRSSLWYGMIWDPDYGMIWDPHYGMVWYGMVWDPHYDMGWYGILIIVRYEILIMV